MNPEEIEQQLIELAQAAGLEVRGLPGAGFREGEPAASSGVCRVRGAVWVLLAPSDSVEEHISVLVSALETHAAGFLEDHYLPPAVRQRLRGLA